MKEIALLLLQFGKTIKVILDIEISHEALGYISLCAWEIANNICKETDVN